MIRQFQVPIFAMTLLAVAGCGKDNPAKPQTTQAPLEFSGAYAMEDWTSTGISGGTTSITPSSGSADNPAFRYTVDLGNSETGVSPRNTTFSAVAAKSGSVTFRWEYTGFHAFYQAYASLTFFAETSAGTTVITEVNHSNVSGSFTRSGLTVLEVEAGQSFGFSVGGENFDSNSRLEGTVTITDFRVVGLD